MANINHTSEKWRKRKYNDGKTIVIYSKSAGSLAQIKVNSPKDESNAQLMLTAQDLLEACIELKACFMDGCGTAKTDTKKNIRLVTAGTAMDKAIKKATK